MSLRVWFPKVTTLSAETLDTLIAPRTGWPMIDAVLLDLGSGRQVRTGSNSKRFNVFCVNSLLVLVELINRQRFAMTNLKLCSLQLRGAAITDHPQTGW